MNILRSYKIFQLTFVIAVAMMMVALVAYVVGMTAKLPGVLMLARISGGLCIILLVIAMMLRWRIRKEKSSHAS